MVLGAVDRTLTATCYVRRVQPNSPRSSNNRRASKHRLVGAGTLLAPLVLLACVPPGYHSGDQRTPKYSAPLFEDYVAPIKAGFFPIPAPEIPRISPSLKFAAPLKLTNPFVEDLKLASIDATKICFEFYSYGDESSKSGEVVAKENLASAVGKSIAIQALTSLSIRKGQPLWPTAAGASHLDSYTIVGDEVRDFDNRDRGTVERRRVVTLHLCAPAPQITNATKFLAITLHFPQQSAPDYESLQTAIDEHDRAVIEGHNQRERLKADALVLIAITDANVELSL